jgi:hypothetical protein
MQQHEELGLRQLGPNDVDLQAHDVDLQAQPEAARKILLGYGKWTTRNGREVVFNCRYRPLWERVSSGDIGMRSLAAVALFYSRTHKGG